MRILGIALVFFLAGAGGPARAQSALTPDEVLQSVERHHPTVAAALARESAARAEVMAARGGFDPQLRVYGALRGGGYYDLLRLDAEVRQPTPLWGAELWAGYRRGQGSQDRYPTYYSDETLDGGELRAGLSVPLWRDGPLDARRAARQRAIFGQEAAEQGRRATQLELSQKALDAYWYWVAAGWRLRVADELLALATARLAQIRARADAGAVPRVDALEAERSVLSRRSGHVSARRGLEAAAIDLGLFVRDRDGAPAVPEADRVPTELVVPPPLPALEPAIAEALSCHPMLRAARASLESQRVRRDLARAQRGPQLDLSFQVSRDFGQGDETLPGTVYEGGVRFAMPLGLRTARGRLDAAEATLRERGEQLRLREDVLATRLRDVASAWRAAQENHDIAHELADTTRRLADAELRRFESGATTLMIVNLREQAAAEASVREVVATRDLWRAAAAWRALTSCNVD